VIIGDLSYRSSARAISQPCDAVAILPDAVATSATSPTPIPIPAAASTATGLTISTAIAAVHSIYTGCRCSGCMEQILSITTINFSVIGSVRVTIGVD
jgi:hypothetical protein